MTEPPSLGADPCVFNVAAHGAMSISVTLQVLRLSRAILDKLSTTDVQGPLELTRSQFSEEAQLQAAQDAAREARHLQTESYYKQGRTLEFPEVGEVAF